MKKLFILLFLTIFVVGCNKENAKHQKIKESKKTQQNAAIDTTNGEQFIVILQLEDSKNKIILSKNELKIIESLLRESAENYNEKGKEKYIDLRYYKRQYFPQIGKNGDKLVGIYCFCSVQPDDDWKNKKLQDPKDGGKCYLHSMINITKGKVVFFQTNSLG